MARRSDHSRDELYDIALEAAANIVEKDGFRALTARNVAEAIGYSPGTLYNLFANLDDMIVHLNGRTLERLDDALRTGEYGGDIEADVFAILDVYLKFLKQHPALWNLLFAHRLPAGVRLPDWYHRKIDDVISVLEVVLTPLFEAGQERQLKQAARVLWAGVHGVISLVYTTRMQTFGDANLTELTENLVSHYLHGLIADLAAGGADSRQ